MNQKKTLHVVVPMFVNPTLFWVVDICRILDREDLEEEIQKVELEVADPIVGEIVAVKDVTKIKRASVCKIDHDCERGKYLCLLIDYGVPFYTNCVYDLEKKFTTPAPTAMRASLSEVVYMHTKLNAEQGRMQFSESTEPTKGARNLMLEHMEDVNDLFFRVEKEKDSIHFGDLIISKNGNHYSITEELVKRKIMAKNATLFWKSFVPDLMADDLSAVVRNSSRGSCASDNFEVTYDHNINTYVIWNTTKQLINEIKSENWESAGRGRRIKTDRNNSRVAADILVKENKTSWFKPSAAEVWSNTKYEPKEVNNKLSEPFNSNVILWTQSEETCAEAEAACPIAKDESEKTKNIAREAISYKHILNSLSQYKKQSAKAEETTRPGTDNSQHWERGAKAPPDSLSVLSKLNSFDDATEKSLGDKGETFVDELMDRHQILVENSQSKTPTKKLSALSKFKKIKDEEKSLNSNGSEPAENQDMRQSPSPTPKEKLGVNILPSGHQLILQPKLQNKTSPKTTSLLKKISTNSKSNRFSTSSSGSSCSDSKHLHFSVVRNHCSSTDQPPTRQIGHNRMLRCLCGSCRFWDEADVDDGHVRIFKDTEGKKVARKLSRAWPLLKTEGDEEEELMSSATIKKGRVAQLPPLVVHGVTIPSPCVNVLDAPFEEDVHYCLRRMGFTDARRIQIYVWPAVMRNMNVCYISGRKSGKTMAYIPAILSFLSESFRYDGFIQMMTGPLVVIMCSGNKQAEEIHRVIMEMMNAMRRRDGVVLALHPISADCGTELSRKHSMLITTPPALVLLLQLRKVSLKRLCHMIFENADIILQQYLDSVSAILSLSHKIVQNRTCCLPIQVILSSETWTNRLSDLVKQLKLPPFICIGAYLEAAVYGRTNIKMHFLESKLKQSALVDVLTDQSYYYDKCIVICNTEEEIEEATSLFPNRSLKSLILKHSLSQSEIAARESNWHNSYDGSYSVLLCTDDVFNKNLHVTDATLLVHYSLPESWTYFSQRFSCLIDHYRPFNTRKSEDATVCKSFIFVDENCQLQFSRLIGFLQRMNVQLPTQFLKHAEMMKQAEEAIKIEKRVNICDTLKLLGYCDNIKCKKRHMLSKNIDTSPEQEGYVKFEILALQDVSVYSVRVIEYIANGNVTKYTNQNSDIESSLLNALNVDRDNLEEVSIGDWVAVLESDTTFKRCEVLKIGSNGAIKVFNLDNGIKATVSLSDLYKLPDEFKNIPPQARTVYVANMVPRDSDKNYSAHSLNLLERIIRVSEKKLGSEIYKGRIRLALRNNLWLDNIVLVHTLKVSEVTLLYVKDKLLQNKLAEFKEDSLASLMELCRNASIPVPEYKEVERREKTEDCQVVAPCYAFLEEGIDYHEIYFRSGNSPSEFFVCLKKFHSLVEQLERDILKELDKPIFKRSCPVEVNKHYLALDEKEGKYSRVQVIAVDEGVANCYFVDYGDQEFIKIENIKVLPDKYLTCLPFQAIECRLYGVQPVLDYWCTEATDILYDYCYVPGTELFRTLYAVVCTKEEARLTNGSKYAILLLDNFSGRTVSIGSLMMDCGFAVCQEGEEFPGQLPVIKNEVVEEELDEEKSETSANVESDESLGGDWDMQIFDAGEMIRGKDIYWSKRLQQNSELPPIKALPLSETRTPTVLWHQTDIHIKLIIQIPAVIDYTLKLLRDRILMFQTTSNGSRYKLNLPLYSKIEKTFQHSAGGLSVKVVMSKCRKEEWPHLTIQKDPKNVKYDVEKCEDPDEEGRKRFLTLKKEFDEELLDDGEKEFCVGSDFDESSESDVMSFD